MVKAVLLDFDGTLVSQDILDVVCEIVGKREESEQVNKDFHAGKYTDGIAPLITRINFLKGVSLEQIQEKLNEKSFVAEGAEDLLKHLKEQGIVSILSSGNIIPILTYYQKVLGIDYIVGTRPKMNGDIIDGISKEDFPGTAFKVIGVKEILNTLGIDEKDTLAIGDSPADKKMFELAGKSIAINPKQGIEQFADHLIKDLREAIPIINELNIA